MSRIASTCLTLALIPCLFGILTGCSTIDMPKGKSKGYTSARMMELRDTAMPGSEGSKDVNRVIHAAIGSEFERQGLTMGGEEAELIVAYMLIIQDNVSTKKIDGYYGYLNDGNEIQEKAHAEGVIKNKRRESFDRGAIVIDVVHAKTNKLLYRGYAVRDILENPTDDVRQRRTEEAVREALAVFFR